MSNSPGDLNWDALQKLAAESGGDDEDAHDVDEVEAYDEPDVMEDVEADGEEEEAAPAKRELPPRADGGQKSPDKTDDQSVKDGPGVSSRLREAMRKSSVRPGQEDTLRSPLVLGLVGGTALLLLIGAVFHFMINRQTSEEAFQEGKGLYDEGKYGNAVTSLTDFLALHGKNEFTNQAMVIRGKAEVDVLAVTRKEYPKALEELRAFVADFQDYEEFEPERPYIAERARVISLEAAQLAGRKKEEDLLKISDEARTIFTTYAAQDIKPKEMIAEIEQTKRASEAEILRSRTQSAASEAIEAALKQQDTMGAIASWRNLVGRYEELKGDAKIRALLDKVLTAERDRVEIEEVGTAAVTEEPSSEVSTPVTFSFHARSSTDEVSGGRCVLALSKDCCYGVDTITGEPVWRRTIGLRTPFFPVIDSATGAAILFDTRLGELQKIEVNSGKLLWRVKVDALASGHPLVSGGRILLPTEGGHLYDISSGDGTVGRRVNFAQAISTPALMPGGERIAIAGHQEVFYVLNFSSLECERVQYLGDGHAAGSIVAPLLPMGPYILACENQANGISSELHVLNAAQPSGDLVEVAATSVEGMVVDPPVIRGQDLFVPSTGERVSSFTVSDVAGQPVLTVGPVYPGQPLGNAPIHLLAGPERQVWIAGSAVRKLQVTGDDLKSDQNAVAVGTVSQPLQYVDRRLFHGRHRPYADAVTFVRMDRDSLEADTQAVLGAKLLAWSVSDRNQLSVITATEAGMVFRTTESKWAEGGIQTTDAQRLPISEDLDEPIAAVAIDKGQLAVAAGGPEPKIWVLNAVGKLDRSVPLTGGPTAPLSFMSQRVLVPMQGRLKLVSTTSGQSIVEDFTLPTEEMPEAVWRTVAATSDTDVVAVLASGDVILARYESTPRHYLGQVARISLEAPVHVQADHGDGLVAVGGGNGIVHLLEAGGLTTRGKREMPAAVSNDVYLAGEWVFVETAGHQLHCLNRDEGLTDVWTLPLDGAALAGRPYVSSGGLLLPLQDGRILAVTTDGSIVKTVETGQGLAGSPFPVGEELFVPTFDGSLVKLGGE